MRRIRGWLSSLLALASFLLLIASVVGWISSRRSRIAAAPSTANVQLQLGTNVPPLHFNNGTLSDVLSFLSDITGMKMEIDWPALEYLGIDRYTTVSTFNIDPTANFGTASKRQRMGVTLAALVSSLHPKAYFTADSGVIRISAKNVPKTHQGTQSLPNPNDPVEVYLRRLTPNPPQPPVPHEAILFHTRFTPVADHGTFRLWITPADAAAIYQDGSRIGVASSPISDFKHEGFGFSPKGAHSPFNTQVLELPFWFTTVVSALLPLLWLYRLIARCRIPSGHCPQCHYDLRATPDLCPECGHIPATP